MNVRPSELVGRFEEAVLFVFLRLEREWLSVRMISRNLGGVRWRLIYRVLRKLERAGLLVSRTECSMMRKKGARSGDMFQMTIEGFGMVVSIDEYNARIRRGIR